ncbi:MAG TPA: protein kinase [Bryobacteraceae bacterium]|nr:protein kinase [Bryobacteraceae bacterium]
MPDNSIGPYQILGQLGAGGMGEVYKALDPRVGRQVALKLLPESLAQDAGRRRRFEQEARLAASLNHPNIMAIYDVGLDHHPPYIVCELVPGESLRGLIAKGPVSSRKCVEIAAQIASGLAAAHTAGIVHRDLKPDNVMITPDGVAKILDFGVARVQTQAPIGDATQTAGQTSAGAVIGTASYMSPEQARAEEVDHRSDQFSLGLVIYEMLAGKQAFERPSAVQTMSAIVEADPPPVERPVPAQLRWILDRCLAKDREGRYESSRDLARELAQLRDHFGELTATGTSEQRPVASRRRTFRAAIPAVCVLAGALIAWCAAALLRSSRAVDISRYRLSPFATGLARQTFPAWSPDGKSIAFLGTDDDRTWRLYVQPLNAATAVQVTGSDVGVNTGAPPFWSPDSQSIYFRCYFETQGAVLCRVPAGGGSSIKVQTDVQSGTISPDGKTLVTWEARAQKNGLALWIASPPEAPRRKYEQLQLKATQWYNNPAVLFAPDGKQILLSIALGNEGETSWLLPWPPGQPRPMFRRKTDFSSTPQPSWLPDSRYLLFSDSPAATHSQLFMADTKTGDYWAVLTEDRSALTPSVSPDGERAAYSSNLSHSDVIAVPLGDGPIRTLLGSSRSEEKVDASRVSQMLVYITNRRGVDEVWLKSLIEGWERPLLTPNDVPVDGESAQGLLSPVFSPDGRRVAVCVKGRSGIHLYTVFTSGGTPVRATSSSDTIELSPTWSPDGNWLAYSAVEHSKPGLLKVRPGSGEPPVTVAEGLYGWAAPVWSPTGEWIADHDLSGHLQIVTPDGKTTRQLPGDDGPTAWARDGKTLYQVRLDKPALVAIDVATGKTREMRDLAGLAPYSNGNPGLSAAVTSDAKDIVYTVNRPRQEIWILDGLQKPQPWYKRLLGR